MAMDNGPVGAQGFPYASMLGELMQNARRAQGSARCIHVTVGGDTLTTAWNFPPAEYACGLGHGAPCRFS